MSAKKMKHPRILEPLEIAHMFKAAKNKGTARDLMMLKCLYYLGLKSNEAIGLLIKDINFSTSKVRVGGVKDREVYIPGEFTFELEDFIKGLKNPSGALFPGRGPGETMSNRHVRRMIKEYARLGEVRNCEEIKPHTLRVSYATHLRKDGIPVKVIQDMMGHSRRETTYMYTHGLTSLISGMKAGNNKENQPNENIQ